MKHRVLHTIDQLQEEQYNPSSYDPGDNEVEKAVESFLLAM